MKMQTRKTRNRDVQKTKNIKKSQDVATDVSKKQQTKKNGRDKSKKNKDQKIIDVPKKIQQKQSKKPLKKSKSKKKQQKSVSNASNDHQKDQQKPQAPTKLMKKYRTKSILQQLSNYSCQLLPQNKHYKITMHNTYQIDQKHKLYPHIPTLFKLFIQKEKRKAESMFLKTRYSFFPSFQFLLSGDDVGEHKCCICQFQFQEPKQISQMERELLDISNEDIVALKCSHLLHLQCLKMLIGDKEWFKCPVCSMIYGKMIGDQPPGKMTWSIHNDMHCDGYPDVGTIVIHYSMNSGTRGTISFPGTGRTAYLPNNMGGNEILNLLKQAFDRKLIFTIGRSVTTGRDNQIVWNGIHHKTNLSGGSAYFGYPDDTYFDRVKLELAAKGVF